MSIYQIVTVGDISGTDALRNIAHYEFAGYVPSAAELQEAVDALDAAYKTRLQGNFHTTVFIRGYDTRRVDVANQPAAFVVPTAGTWAGTATGVIMPPFCAVLMTFKAVTTFPRTARTYLFPMPVSAVAGGGGVTGAVQAQAELWANDVLELAVTGQINADKVTVTYTGTPRVVTSDNDLTSFAVNPRFSPLRSRKQGKGA